MNNKNILLSTIYKADNYGALFQAYSLNYFLQQKHQNSVFILNSSPKKISRQFTALRTYSFKAFLKDLCRYHPRKQLINKFKDFITENFNEVTLKEISDLKIDLCVTGSDQVWNPNIISFNNQLLGDYFFENIDAKKIAFSASLGSYRYNDEQLSRFNKLIDSYSCITVREQDTATYLSEVTSHDVFNTLDPTLIQPEGFWNKLTTDSFTKKDYILVYYNNKTKDLTETVNQIKNDLNLPVIVINNWYNSEINSDKYIRNAGPIDFLNAFKNAKYIITNTFHGVCFSINFKKEFLYIDNGIHSNRMTSLLSKVDGLHKIITKNNEACINNLTKSISYEKLENEKNLSTRILMEHL